MDGEEVLRVVCVGEGAAGGGLATLCGPWAALQFPKANVDVITFAAPWVGACQPAWSGGWIGAKRESGWAPREACMQPCCACCCACCPPAPAGGAHRAAHPARCLSPPALQQGYNPQFSWAFEQLVALRYRWPFAAPAPAAIGTAAAAAAVNPFITKQVLPEAVRVPGLPDMAPEALQEAGERSFDEIYAALVGQQPPESLLPEPSDCPVLLCKVRAG